jgi:hypothetical protein
VDVMSDEIRMPERWHVLTVPGDCTVMGAIAGESPGVEVGTGWVRAPDEVAKVMAAWEVRGTPATLSRAAPHIAAASATEEPVFFWKYEEKVLGKLLATWNQKQVGSCTGFGSTRAAQDTMFAEIAAGDPYDYPGAEFCPEITYAGGRHEIGKDKIRGDGGVGAWVAEFMVKYGVLTRGKYDGIDLTSYDESMCRLLGNRGVPDALEPTVRQHPVTAAAMVESGEDVWQALGANKCVFLCSDRGFSYELVDGFCKPSGTWNHCMGIRGRFVHPTKGRSVVIGNSWADYLNGSRQFQYVAADGTTKTGELPVGCFCTTLDVVNGMAKQQDSFALAGVTGWAKTRVDYEL